MSASRELENKSAEMMRAQADLVEKFAEYLHSVLAELDAPHDIKEEARRLAAAVVASAKNAQDAQARLFREFNSRLTTAELQLAAFHNANRMH